MIDPLHRITGLTIEQFAGRHWGIAPLYRTASERSGDGFADLLSLTAVDELVSQRGLRTPFARMSRDGDVLSPARFTRGGGAGAEIADQLADDKVLAEFADGATLVLQALHRTWAPIQSFARELSTQLGHPVQVNAYVTPPQNAGFAPHYDVHDVFVLQFAGRKRWRVHEPVIEAPLRDQPWQDRKSAVAGRAAETPAIDRVLAPGDTMYLPRGYIHSAESLDGISGHLTVGVHPVTRRFLVDRVIASLADEVALRRSLPLGPALSDHYAIDAEIAATIAALHDAIDRFDTESVESAIVRHLAAATRPAPIGPLEQLAAADGLDANARVRLRPGLRPIVRRDRETVLELHDREIRLPASHETAVRRATSGAVVSAIELPDIEPDAATLLLARLLRDGVVVPA